MPQNTSPRLRLPSSARDRDSGPDAKAFPGRGWVVAQSAGPGAAVRLPRPPGQALALPRSAAAPRHLAPQHLASSLDCASWSLRFQIQNLD